MLLRRVVKNLRQGPKDGLKRLLSVVPPGWRQGGAYWRWRRVLAEAQTWSATQIEGWQVKRLREVVRYAFEHTEGYRDLYRSAGISPDDIRSVADVRKLPLTSKEMLQGDLQAFTVDEKQRVYLTTGGSTGIPFG